MTPPTKAQLRFTLTLFLACPPSQGELGIERGWTLEAFGGGCLEPSTRLGQLELGFLG